ncbi:putative tRNA pseudouridine synthase Pus10 [Polypterus senegalus]|nr:putative tRNA pseudouridine synthase Pus10 [Polypterus senegalus]
MLPLQDKDRSVVQVLLKSGCCSRCVLRFCFVGLQVPYRQPSKVLAEQLFDFAFPNDVNKCVPYIQEEKDPPYKKIKLEEPNNLNTGQDKNDTISLTVPEFISSNKDGENICVVCLGVLQDYSEKDFAAHISNEVKSAQFQFDNFVISVSLPAQLSVREHAMWLLVKQEVGNKGLYMGRDDVIQVKEVYKWIIHPFISEELGVPVDSKSCFEISVVFSHPETNGDCHFLALVCSDCFKPAKNKQSVFTRMAVIKALEKIKEEDFRKQYSCPPRLPVSKCLVEDIQCLHAPVYVAGRYNKYSRTLPQTPWVIDGERKMESSVEELISEHLLATFKADGFNFSSSGREDVDVRTLGNGRPFAVELQNPHRSSFTKEDIKRLQQTINNSSDKIRVRDLQIVTREAVSRMKEGEEEKTKSYSALIWTAKSIDKSDIEFINDIKVR